MGKLPLYFETNPVTATESLNVNIPCPITIPQLDQSLLMELDNTRN